MRLDLTHICVAVLPYHCHSHSRRHRRRLAPRHRRYNPRSLRPLVHPNRYDFPPTTPSPKRANQPRCRRPRLLPPRRPPPRRAHRLLPAPHPRRLHRRRRRLPHHHRVRPPPSPPSPSHLLTHVMVAQAGGEYGAGRRRADALVGHGQVLPGGRAQRRAVAPAARLGGAPEGDYAPVASPAYFSWVYVLLWCCDGGG